jgi:hypothetical protein
LPFLKFTRDSRGYESTFLVHAFRRRGKARQRILYWFRTPPGVKVGRPALDEEAIRWIEEHNPDVAFDWTKILDVQPPSAAPATTDGRRRKQKDRQRRDQRPRSQTVKAQPESQVVPPVTEESAAVPHEAELDEQAPEPLPLVISPGRSESQSRHGSTSF